MLTSPSEDHPGYCSELETALYIQIQLFFRICQDNCREEISQF